MMDLMIWSKFLTFLNNSKFIKVMLSYIWYTNN
jgi:hypothetical protein